MSMSPYYRDLRQKLGNQLIFVPAVVAVIRNENDEILFGRKHNEEQWGIIAGAIEIGETPAEALCREVGEETGLQVIPETIIGVFGGEEQRFTYPNGHQVEYLTIVFSCTVKGGALLTQSEEMGELRYFSERELPPIANKYPPDIFKKATMLAQKALFEKVDSQNGS
ncbi:NUDIX domain-containing protein [Brevibacillus fluminis]|uniref:NUDIX domain-containing protein n=1 Tax=Brevibacillus fluminis TaxID=511487 RepID=A0A3M8DCW4_9BACL|nr:NUDIX domain-containing protein [Brevibacillus fluminis]RNB85145.1 NUDIX domain-containing protein [Brevibacillus fluminis]